jgi:hypothetical protein
MSLFCTRCGHSIQMDASFCDKCGSAVIPKQLDENIHQKTFAKRDQRFWVIAILLLLTAGGFMAMFNSQDSKNSESISNVADLSKGTSSEIEKDNQAVNKSTNAPTKASWAHSKHEILQANSATLVWLPEDLEVDQSVSYPAPCTREGIIDPSHPDNNKYQCYVYTSKAMPDKWTAQFDGSNFIAIFRLYGSGGFKGMQLSLVRSQVSGGLCGPTKYCVGGEALDFERQRKNGN